MSQRPVVFDLEATQSAALPSVADAPAVPDDDGRLEAVEVEFPLKRRRSGGRIFWSLGGAVFGVALSLILWDFATSLILRIPVLGWIVSAALAVLAVMCCAFVLRELAAMSCLRRVDGLRRAAGAAREDLKAARRVVADLGHFFRDREDLTEAFKQVSLGVPDIMDADATLDFTETTVLTSLDIRAHREIEVAARQVAVVTAFVPLALVDVIAALIASTRMIRRIGEIYGGRSGLLSSWRLARAVLTHLAATGVMAAGDDLLESALGGSVLSKLSRRFGEGLVNGALTARVGVAAMEVCRPMPFSAQARPSTRKVIKRALAGVFKSEK